MSLNNCTKPPTTLVSYASLTAGMYNCRSFWVTGKRCRRFQFRYPSKVGEESPAVSGSSYISRFRSIGSPTGRFLVDQSPPATEGRLRIYHNSGTFSFVSSFSTTPPHPPHPRARTAGKLSERINHR